MRAVLLSIAALSFAIYGIAIQRFFARPDGVPPKMRALSILGTICATLHVIWLAFRELSASPGPAIALALYATGLALFAWAWLETRSSPLPLAFSTTPSSKLVTSGPYAFLRHPFYTAYSLTWLAGVVATASIVAAGSAALMIGIYMCAAREESREIGSHAVTSLH